MPSGRILKSGDQSSLTHHCARDPILNCRKYLTVSFYSPRMWDLQPFSATVHFRRGAFNSVAPAQGCFSPGEIWTLFKPTLSTQRCKSSSAWVLLRLSTSSELSVAQQGLRRRERSICKAVGHFASICFKSLVSVNKTLLVLQIFKVVCLMV